MTRTQLANLALSHLGARRLADLDTDDNVEARAARLHFDLTFRAHLRRHQWNFSTRRAQFIDTPTPAVAAAVTLNPAGDHNNLTFTAKTAGAAGNDLSVRIVIAEDSTALTVSEAAGLITATSGNKRRMLIDVDGETIALTANGETHNGWPVWTFGGVPYASWNTGTFPRGFLRATSFGFEWQVGNTAGMLEAATGPGSGSPPADYPDVFNSEDFTASPATASQVITAAAAVTTLSTTVTLPTGNDGTGPVAAVAATDLVGGVDTLYPNQSDSNEYPYVFPLPSDFVRLIRLATTDVHNPVRSFSIEGRNILTHADSFELVYVSDDCLDDLDDLFIESFTLSLAAKLAADVTADPNLKSSLTSQIEQLHLPAAQNVDAKEVRSGENFGPRALASMSGLVNARFRSDGRPPYTPDLSE